MSTTAEIMSLSQLVKRKAVPQPWDEGEKIPWDDPDFSRRMLEVHLVQDNDWASRRRTVVEQHVNWIETHWLNPGARVLDICCGPGLYTHRLAEKGHRCFGIDFSPASVEYARDRATTSGLAIDYQLADIRQATFGSGFDLATMIFGEFNVFHPRDATQILQNAHAALNPGGTLLVEGHTFEEVKNLGLANRNWSSHETGLFYDGPHLQLEEFFWDPDSATTVSRYFVIDVEDSTVLRYASTTQAYTDEQYHQMLNDAGFVEINIHAKMQETPSAFEGKLQILSAKKPTR